MYLDASAIVSILAREDDAELLLLKLEAAPTPFYVSPMTIFEATIALAAIAAKPTKKPPTPETIDQARATVEEFVSALAAKEILVSGDIGRRAIDAAKTYGRVVGHRADLNFGDCFAYACAKAYRVGLLYTGNDFTHTDINDKERL